MILDILYVFSLATLAAAALTNVAGVNLYDAKQVKRQSHQIKHPHAKPYRIRPLVSIIVTGHETYLEECLNSLAKLKYKNVEIIVSITQPTKSSKKIVHNFRVANVNKQIRYIQKQQLSNNFGSIKTALRQARGEVVLVIDSGTSLEKDSVHQAITRFNLNPDLGILMCNIKAIRSEDITSIFQSLSLLIKGHVMKTASYFSSLEQSKTFDNSFYKKSVLKKLVKLYKDDDLSYLYNFQAIETDYESSAVLNARSMPLGQFMGNYFNMDRYSTITWLLRFRALTTTKSNRARAFILSKLIAFSIFNLARLAWPILLGYFAYLAIGLKQPDFLIVSWAAMALFMAYVILTSERLRYLQKLSLIVLMPVYFSWYCLSLVLHYLSVITVPVAFIRDENFA